MFKELPDDFQKHSVRDVSLLLSAVFTKIHFTHIKELFNADFTAIFMHCLHGQTGIYRSPKENGNFARIVGERCIRESNFAERIARESKKFTDIMHELIKENNSFDKLVNNSKKFFENFEFFFAYHQAVGFGGEYLAETYTETKRTIDIQKVIDILDKTYGYQELVAPNLEKYFDKLQISDLLPEEIMAGRKKPKSFGRSIMYFKDKQFVLEKQKAKFLAENIDKKNKKSIRFEGILKGLGVGGGTFTGKAQIITELNLLDTVKPGCVLVVPITRPQYNNYIKRAGAIVSDIGGLLSHPSILAREQKIPCIVGTKIGTQVLKNGDLIKIDADKGFAEIIKD